MRLELGSRVDCSDGASGELAAIVVDPATTRVTHLVVGAPGEPWSARLAPVALVAPGDRGERGVELRATVQGLRELPPARDVGYPHLVDFPVDDPDWDVGIHDVYAPPSSASNDLQPQASESPVVYDRIPKGEVEIRRSSGVFSAEGRRLGHVDGFLVDRDELITHVVLERGHLGGRHEVTVPAADVAKLETDDVTLSLTKDEVDARERGAVTHGSGA